VTISWSSVSGASYYRVYASTSFDGTYTAVNETTNLNYTDTNTTSPMIMYYKVAAVSAVGENLSDRILGKVTYVLQREEGSNTRNWIAMPFNLSSLLSASDLLNSVTNATSVSRWNATGQAAQTCNDVSCPTEGCTPTNCNFELEPGAMYEVNINGNASTQVNWTTSGHVMYRTNVTGYKIEGTFSRNWIITKTQKRQAKRINSLIYCFVLFLSL